MTDAGNPVTPPSDPDSAHQGGFDLGGPPQAGKHYRVLARKYRPSSFDDLIGQDAVVRTVSNAFETGRIPQAWILTGVRGVGKTTTARILARALNYELPDGSAKGPTIHMPVPGVHCQAIMESRHMDVLEMDAASHTGVDDVRQINDSVRYAPASARYKVYIIDEVHMLSTAAFNAFLKTLEEPPEHAKFVFATTEIRKVPVTVLSRCQRFDLRRVDADVLMAHLANIAGKENVEVEPEALGIIARAAEGSVRDSLSLFDQAIAHAAGPVRADAVRQMLGLADRTRVIDLFEFAGARRYRQRFQGISRAIRHRRRSDRGAVRSGRIRQFRHPGQDRAGDGGQCRVRRNRARARPRLRIKALDAGAVADVADAAQGHHRSAGGDPAGGSGRNGAGAHRLCRRHADPRRSDPDARPERRRVAGGRIEFGVGARLVRIDGVLDAALGGRAHLGAARQRRGVRPPADDRADGAKRRQRPRRFGLPASPNWWRWPARNAIS